jgi:Zn-dependent protease with chaperone function
MRAMKKFAILLCLPLCALAAVAVPEPSEKAMSYYYTRNTLWLVTTAWSLFVPALLLFTGWSARIRDVALRAASRPALTLLLYLLILGAIGFALDLPFAWYEEFRVEHEYGLSNQTLAKWFADAFIGTAVTTVITYLVLLGLYRLLQRSPKRWWFYMGLVAIPFVFLVFMVTPIWIAPMFNKFGPMKDKALETHILALADRAGIEGGRVFEVEKSVDTKKISAYVSGFGETKRIVLWDTLVKRLTEREILFVMGHEMGHYVLGHVWKTILMICALVMLCFYGVHRVSHRLIDRHRARFGFDRLEDIASWPLIVLVAQVIVLLAAPAFNAYIRAHEHEADRFGLEITRDNDAAANAFVKLTTDNLNNPRPGALVHLLRDNHPSLAERIEFANTYRPWETGEPLKYGDEFRR